MFIAYIVLAWVTILLWAFVFRNVIKNHLHDCDSLECLPCFGFLGVFAGLVWPVSLLALSVIYVLYKDELKKIEPSKKDCNKCS